MYKTRYLLTAVVAVFSLVLWSGSSFSQEWVEGTVQSYYQPKGWSTFEAGWLIGHKVYSPLGGDLGQVADLVIDRSDGHIALVILSDVPGFEDRYAAAPFNCLVRTGENIFYVSFGDREVPIAAGYQDPYAYELERYASTVGLNHIPSAIDPLWADSLYRFYGQTPYWTEGSMPHSDLMVYRATERTDLFFGETQTPGLIGARIQSSDGNAMARIDDLVIDPKDGRVALVVLFEVAGRGDAMVAVPFGELSMSGNAFVFNTAGDRLASAPDFRTTDLDNQRKVEDVYIFFGLQPYWTTGGPAMEHHDDMGTNGSTMETPSEEGGAAMEP